VNQRGPRPDCLSAVGVRLGNAMKSPILALAASPEISFKTTECQQIKAVEPNVAKMALSNMPDEHALAAIVGRRLGEFAGTGDVAAADVEPVTGKPPFWNSVHSVAPNRART
jgi:hypothetical protein